MYFGCGLGLRAGACGVAQGVAVVEGLVEGGFRGHASQERGREELLHSWFPFRLSGCCCSSPACSAY